MAKRILIVEDSPTQRENMDMLLSEAGYETMTACHGEEGLIRARKCSPDLILSDIEMPHMDGYTMTEQITSDPRTAKIPVVLLSNLDHLESLQRGYSAGACDFLSKREDSIEQILATIEINVRVSENEAALLQRVEEDPRKRSLQDGSITAMEHLGFGVALVDLRRKLSYANQRARSFFRLTPDQDIGEVDHGLVEAVVTAAFATISMNNRQFLTPIPSLHPHVQVRLEEFYNHRQEIAGLIFVVWYAEP